MIHKSVFVHTLVKNEERWLWFAVNSVAPYVDRILLWDTGSTDRSIEIEKELVKKYRDKISFRQVGEVDSQKFTEVRQEMLDASNCDWVMILDGDEVWWEDGIKRAIDVINKRGDDLESLVHRYYNLVGDIYHYQEEEAGRYSIDGVTGHLTIRFFNRKIPGLHFSNPHGRQGIYDGDGVLIQKRDNKKRLHLDDYYLHFTHLVRSSTVFKDKEVIKRNIKYKYELGIPFPRGFKYPEVFYQKRPDFVFDPWQKRSGYYVLRAFFETFPKKLKRRFWKKGGVGY
ncbi:MAG: Glycosyl transferase family 2 [Candidatus Woesebacteria bacterium]|nr:MAG: Glycosyl transferase family 2 [Candidatus Woesebacteria bacterium]